MGKTILNIAAGKRIPDTYEVGDFLIQLDPMYAAGVYSSMEEVEIDYINYVEEETAEGGIYWVKEYALDFLGPFKFKFDLITIHRRLEHISTVEDLLTSFLYMVADNLKADGLLEVIVPDHALLAQMLLDENVYSDVFEKNDIIITTEFCNIEDDPHLSIWTKDRLKMRLEKEDRFKTLEIQENYKFDGRDIYLYGVFQMIVNN